MSDINGNRTKTFEFPALVTFLYRCCSTPQESSLDVSPSLVEQARRERVITNKHPNSFFQDNEYKGHCIHEMNDITNDYLKKQKSDYAPNP